MDPDVIIPRSNIHLGKVPGVVQPSDQCKREGKRVRVLYRPIVDVPVILTGTEFSALLANKKEPTRLGGLRLGDKPFLLILIDKCLDR